MKQQTSIPLPVGLARRYRPRKFSEVIDQESAVRAIQNALNSDTFGSAYLFFGTRGVGKTTLARLIARRINCKDPQEGEPCGLCESCTSIESGQSIDVIEIDAASHRGIDYIRELCENVKFRPMASYKKVYIIDEVHMLTQESFNALLKTLEEPPDHIVFVLATTEYHKVPQTVLSRCQIFNLKKVPLLKLQNYLSDLCQKEKITYDEEALFWIARSGDGSLRDSISSLEKAIHYCGKKLETDKVKELIGNTPSHFFIQLTHSLLKKDSSVDKLLSPISEFFSIGYDLQRFIWEYLDFLKSLMYIKKGILDIDIIGLPEAQIHQFSREFADNDEIHLHIIFREFFSLLAKSKNIGLRNSYEMRVLIEMELISIREKLQRPSLSGVLQKLNQFSAALAGGKSYSFEHELQKQFLGTVVDKLESTSIEPEETKK